MTTRVERASSPPAISRALLQFATFAALAIVALFMVLQAGQQWRDVLHVQADRLDGGTPPSLFEDYAVFYAAGTMVVDGNGDDLYDLDALAAAEANALERTASDGVLVYLNPPSVAALFTPFTLLPAYGAAVAMSITAGVLAVACALVLLRIIRPCGSLEQAWFALWFISLTSVPWLVAQGQLSPLPFLGLGLSALAQMQGKARLSGLALALCLVKPHYVVLAVVVLIWKRRWAELQVFGCVAAVFAAVSVAISGSSVLAEYPLFLLETTKWERESGVNLLNMFGWSGFYARLLGGVGLTHSLLTLTSTAITVVGALSLFRGQWRPKEPAFALGWAALVVASLLSSAHLYTQDLLLLALAVGLGVNYQLRTSGSIQPWAIAAFVVWIAELYGRRLLVDHGMPVVTPVMLLLLLLIWWHYQTQREPAPALASVGSRD